MELIRRLERLAEELDGFELNAYFINPFKDPPQYQQFIADYDNTQSQFDQLYRVAVELCPYHPFVCATRREKDEEYEEFYAAGPPSEEELEDLDLM